MKVQEAGKIVRIDEPRGTRQSCPCGKVATMRRRRGLYGFSPESVGVHGWLFQGGVVTPGVHHNSKAQIKP